MSMDPKEDGRHKRKEHNKRKTIESILDMILETGEDPSIEAIVERSGVSRRSVFYYFNNREILIGEINNLIHERIKKRFSYPEADPRRGFRGTLKAFLHTRIEIFEYIAPLKIITEEKKRRNSHLKENFRATLDLEFNLIDNLFSAYFKESQDWEEIRTLFAGTFSWNLWSFYRYECNFSIKKSRKLLERHILAISGIDVIDP